MSLLLPDSGLLFWMLLSFGVVFVVLAKYGFPVITKMVEGRKTYIDQSLEVAREANAQLSKLYGRRGMLGRVISRWANRWTARG